MSLIHRLNQMATLTPDEIATKLKGNNGWLQGKDFTQKMVEDAQGRRYHVLSPRGSDLDHYNFDFSFARLQKGLDKHWFKPQDEYGGPRDRLDLEA